MNGPGNRAPSEPVNPPYYGQLHADHRHVEFPPRVKQRKARRAVLTLVGVFGGTLVALCVIGAIVASLSGGGKPAHSPLLDDVTASPTASAASAPVANGEPAKAVPSAAVPSKAPPATTGFSAEGTLLVPAEVKPGTYRATVPADSSNCYWARLKGTSHELENVIANGNANPGAKVTVTVKPTDKAFHSEGCGAWIKV